MMIRKMEEERNPKACPHDEERSLDLLRKDEDHMSKEEEFLKQEERMLHMKGHMNLHKFEEERLFLLKELNLQKELALEYIHSSLY